MSSSVGVRIWSVTATLGDWHADAGNISTPHFTPSITMAGRSRLSSQACTYPFRPKLAMGEYLPANREVFLSGEIAGVPRCLEH
jgi:hypothetical protein